MPAARSRTEHWKESLLKIKERGGALEISVARGPTWQSDGRSEVIQPGSDIVWRVKVVSVSDAEIIVEPPAAFGEAVRLHPSVELIGAMTVGQNRWMFRTRTVGERRTVCAGTSHWHLVLSAPVGVERCTRRHFYRTSTTNLNLPDVQCWPLIDPSSVVLAESANRAQIEHADNGPSPAAFEPGTPSEPTILPDVGPMFPAKMVNISGGGLGLRIDPDMAAAAERRPYLWLRVDLRPQISAPIAVTARIAHTHIDSMQHLYAGMAFDFVHNPEHRRFVIQRFAAYVDRLQNDQRAAAKVG